MSDDAAARARQRLRRLEDAAARIHAELNSLASRMNALRERRARISNLSDIPAPTRTTERIPGANGSRATVTRYSSPPARRSHETAAELTEVAETLAELAEAERRLQPKARALGGLARACREHAERTRLVADPRVVARRGEPQPVQPVDRPGSVPDPVLMPGIA